MTKFDAIREADIVKAIKYRLETRGIKKIEGSGKIPRLLPPVKSAPRRPASTRLERIPIKRYLLHRRTHYDRILTI